MIFKRKLSKKELSVLCYLAQADDEIAFQLCVSPNTVKTQIQRIFNKLNCKNRTQAVICALKNDLISLEDIIYEV